MVVQKHGVSELSFKKVKIDGERLIAGNVITINDRHLIYAEEVTKKEAMDRLTNINAANRTPQQMSNARRQAMADEIEKNKEASEESPLPLEVED
jgi:hypothetical protein